MAANEYYNTSFSHHPDHQPIDSSPPPPPPSSTKPPTSLYANNRPSRGSDIHSLYSATPSIDSPRDNQYHSRESYYSSVVGGTLHDEHQYADNIPLKSPHPRPYSQDDLAGQNTQYPPSPISQQRPKSSRSRRQKQGWFTGKITWVIYLVTLVQIGVFIGEIVSSGECLARLGESN
jgi:hypothetical protein